MIYLNQKVLPTVEAIKKQQEEDTHIADLLEGSWKLEEKSPGGYFEPTSLTSKTRMASCEREHEY